MRVPLTICALFCGLLAALPVSAQEADVLRRELDEMRRQFEAVREQYQKAIDTMSERIRRLEEQPPTVAAPPSAPQQVALQTPSPSASAQLTAQDLLRRREPFSLYQRGQGQFLFDMGIAGDFIANFTPRRADRANAGTFAGRENRFFPREIELNLFGQIDPYARGEVRIEAGEEVGEDEISVHLAEATLTLLTLPFGTQAKLGQMRNRFGLINQVHEHDMPFIDRPNVLVRFFGEEGLVERGVEATWVPPLPFYLEALVGVFNGDNETAFGRRKLNDPLITGRLRTFLELTDTTALQLGVSAAHGETAERQDSTILGADAKLKYRPTGWLHPLLTLAAEALYSIRDVRREGEIEALVDTDGDGIPDTTVTEIVSRTRTRNRFGWYGHAEIQPWRRWAFGGRYDWTEFPEGRGSEWAVGPYVSFMPSEFLRFRLGYKHTERSRAASSITGVPGGRSIDEVLLQGTFLLGAHPAHPF